MVGSCVVLSDTEERRGVYAPRQNNFVEYEKAGREGKISTLPAQSLLCASWQPQAAREQIKYTLEASGCQKGKNLPPDNLKLSESQKDWLWQPQDFLWIEFIWVCYFN